MLFKHINYKFDISKLIFTENLLYYHINVLLVMVIIYTYTYKYK